MAAGQASSALFVECIVKANDVTIGFVDQIPDKGPNQAKLLGEAVRALRQAEGFFQQYVNSRASGIS